MLSTDNTLKVDGARKRERREDQERMAQGTAFHREEREHLEEDNTRRGERAVSAATLLSVEQSLEAGVNRRGDRSRSAAIAERQGGSFSRKGEWLRAERNPCTGESWTRRGGTAASRAWSKPS